MRGDVVLSHRRWFVCTLKPGATQTAPLRRGVPEEFKGESVVERSLREAGIEGYLPRMKHRLRHPRSKRIHTKTRVLFTGYVFIADPGQRADRVRSCEGIDRYLAAGEWAIPCPPGSVEAMQKAQADGLFDRDDVGDGTGRAKQRLARHRFAAGTRVRPTKGPFAGFNGLVEDVTGQGLIKVAIEIFGRATPVEFETGMLEPI